MVLLPVKCRPVKSYSDLYEIGRHIKLKCFVELDQLRYLNSIRVATPEYRFIRLLNVCDEAAVESRKETKPCLVF